MTVELMKILNDQANSFIDKVKENLESTGTNATKKSADSLHYIITEDGTKITLEVLGKPYFAVVETGRKATPDKKPSRAMIENITEWTNARGLPESMVWAVATKIQNEGTELFKKGGRTDIYTKEQDLFIDQLGEAVTEYMADLVVKQIHDEPISS